MSSCYVWMPGWPTMQPIGGPTPSLPVIYLYCTGQVGYGKCFHGEALAEDGTILYRTRRGSTALVFLRTDLLKHDRFVRYYPNGYRTEWVDAPAKHAGVIQAQARAWRDRQAAI